MQADPEHRFTIHCTAGHAMGTCAVYDAQPGESLTIRSCAWTDDRGDRTGYEWRLPCLCGAEIDWDRLAREAAD